MAARILPLHTPRHTKRTAPEISTLIDVAASRLCWLALNCCAEAVKKVRSMEGKKANVLRAMASMWR